MSGIMEKLVEEMTGLREAVEKNNDLLTKIVTLGGKGIADAGDKPAGKRGPKAKAKEDEAGEGDDDAKVDADDLAGTLNKVKGWLKEFAEEGDADPENQARAQKLAKALKTLNVEKISSITKESDRARVDKWVDDRIEGGRLTEAPTKKAAAADPDEEI